jgi:L-alanine-DL-glutamate epimerase-like enolase superfamily enzyme
MKIRSVSALWLKVPIAEEKRHTSSYGRAPAFDTVLVRIETECGLVGHGEGKSSVFTASDNHALVQMVEREFGPMLVGQDPRDISRLWDLMYNGSRAGYAIEHGRAFPQFGRRGVSLAAISGIDVACWDILGQSLGVPVWRLLGGKRRDRMPAYASGGWAPAETIGKQLQEYCDRGGFKAVKMRVGVADGPVRESVRRVKAAREALGDDIGLMCDAHGTMNVPDAKRFCRLVEDCNLMWFEEPVGPDNKAGMAEVRASTDIPIAAGESEVTRFEFRDLIAARAVDILQPDLAIAGGLTEGLRIEALCSAHQLRLAAHIWGGAPSFAAGVHLSAVASTSFILEYSLGANPMLHELANESFPVVDGMVTIPDGPGLGFTINEDFVKRYTVR